jgi:hypothetical protein
LNTAWCSSVGLVPGGVHSAREIRPLYLLVAHQGRPYAELVFWSTAQILARVLTRVTP